MNNTQLKDICRKVGQNFRTFGGGIDPSGSSNPIVHALADKPLQTAAGVDVADLVKFIAFQLGTPIAVSEQEAIEAGGRWINADDIRRMVEDMDRAMNGCNLTPGASLCDVVAQAVPILEKAREFAMVTSWMGR